MISLIAMFLVVMIIFVIARIYKDHRVYTRLCLYALATFVAASCVKSKFIDTESDSKTVITVQNPTQHSVNHTNFDVDGEAIDQQNINVVSQEIEGDTVITENESPIYEACLNTEIEDDS